MTDAVGDPRSLLLMGGTSHIGLAIAERYARRVTGLRVVLAARDSERRAEAAGLLRSLGCEVAVVDLDAEAPETHAAVVEEAARGGDVDLAVVAYGLLGDPEEAWTDVEVGTRLARVNFVGPVATGIALAERVRRQGHGTIVALSSVAGERPRRSNFVYGSTKAGFDAFYTGLGEAVRELGGRVVVVRPGFVHSRMTAGLDAAPLAVTPEAVAEAVETALDKGTEQVWVPAAMRPVMSVLRHVPRPVFRRLPL